MITREKEKKKEEENFCLKDRKREDKSSILVKEGAIQKDSEGKQEIGVADGRCVSLKTRLIRKQKEESYILCCMVKQ